MPKIRHRRRDRRNKNRLKDLFTKDENSQEQDGYEDIEKTNEDFEKYYKAQGIVPEGEWEIFLAALRESLPAAFRITGCKSHAKALLEIIQSNYFDDLLKNQSVGEEDFEKPVCLSWYPENVAWQLNLTRKSIRKSKTYSKLHSFLVSETESGNISRQETVSMIPPLLLDVKSHHKVLDMCAAPGSKTAQLIEMLHADDTNIPDGVLIANDVDNKRCYMLVHQAKRLQSPSFIITNHDASSMPNIRIKRNNEEVEILKYDRILCDVPCSGDGTARKNLDVWKKWNAANGNNLHGLQARIAKRGLELLAVGGKMVYSTCSLNPLEDEAVVHNLLVQFQGSVVLVDESSKVSGLKFSPGLSNWKVMSRELEEFSSPDEVPEKYATQIRPNMFPPSPEKAADFHLDRCMRILPHHQNTGGFFVAVLQKIAPLSGEKSNVSNVDKNSVVTAKSETDNCAVEERTASPPRKKPKFHGYKEDPFVFFADNEEIWPSIRNFYGIDPSFQQNCLFTRSNQGKKRNVYFASQAVKDIIVDNQDRLKIINTGIKVFCRCDNKGVTCDFRLAQEGLNTIISFIKSRLVKITHEDLVLLLTNEYPFYSKTSQQTRHQLQDIETGCLVLVYEKTLPTTQLKIQLCGWKGKTSLRAYVPKSERVHYLRLCGEDTSNYEMNKNKKFKCDEKAAENQDETEVCMDSVEDNVNLKDNNNSESVE